MANIIDGLWLHLYHMIFSTSLNNFLSCCFFCQYFHPAPCPLQLKLRQYRIPHACSFTFIRSDPATIFCYNVLNWILKDIQVLNWMRSCSWWSVFVMHWQLGHFPQILLEIFASCRYKLFGGWITACTWALLWLSMCKKNLRIPEIIN